MSHAPPEDKSSKQRVYLSADNRLYLALKVFGYSLLGYLLIIVPLVAFVLMGGFLAG
jgi:hypothetical protein